MLSGSRQFGLLAATFTAMLLTAKLFSKVEAKQERPPKIDASVGVKTEASLARQTEPVPATVNPIHEPLPATTASPCD
jgi:hypothetical protein